MKNKTILIFAFVLIVLSSSVIAIPPVSTAFQGDVGLNVLTPAPRYLQAGAVGETTAYVFNVSNGVQLDNSTVQCEALVQYPNGTRLAKVNGIGNNGHFDFNLNLTNVHLLGEYSWIMLCNSSYQGGYVTGAFELTETGTANNETILSAISGGGNDSGITLSSTLLCLALMGFLGFFGYVLYREDSFIFIVGYLLWYIAMLIPLVIIRIILNTYLLNPNMESLLSLFYMVYLLFYGFMVLLLIVYFMALTLSYLFPDIAFFKRKKKSWDKYRRPL